MTPKKTTPLVVMIVTVMCTLPAAAGAIIPAAIAQEDPSYDDDEDLASDIVSEVLDGGGDADDETDQDATNTGIVNPNQDQTLGQDNVGEFGDDTAGLDDTNVAVPIAIPIDIDVIEEEPPLPPEEEEPPEFEAFCLVTAILLPSASFCFDTSEECDTAEERIIEEAGRDSIIRECHGVEALPPDALICVIEQEGEEVTVSCITPPEDI